MNCLCSARRVALFNIIESLIAIQAVVGQRDFAIVCTFISVIYFMSYSSRQRASNWNFIFSVILSIIKFNDE